MDNAIEIIKELLHHLPDSVHYQDESWDWCWGELSEDAEGNVKKVRKRAEDFVESEEKL